MNGWVEAPPRKPMGCFAKGCLILVVFGIILGIACGVGIYWGLHHYSAISHSFRLLNNIGAISDHASSIPAHETSDEKIQAALARWRDFESVVDEGQASEIELTADDLNDLIASNRDTRDKLFASIEGNRLRLQTSVPLGQMAGRSGYFFNGDITIATDGPDSVARPHLENITINGKRLPSEATDWTFNGRPLRDYLSGNENPWNATTVEIRDGKIILRSRHD
jgi:hypothetical protein